MPAPTSFIDSSIHGNTGIATNIIDDTELFRFYEGTPSIDFETGQTFVFESNYVVYPDPNVMLIDTIPYTGYTYNSRLAPIQLLPFYIKNNSFVLQWTPVAPSVSFYRVDIANDINFTSMVSSYYTNTPTSATNMGIVGDDITSLTSLYARVTAYVDGVTSYYSNIIQITKSAGTSYGTRASYIDFYVSNEVDSLVPIFDDSINHYNMLASSSLNYTDKLAIIYENDLILPKTSYVPRAVLNGLTEYTFAVRAKFNAVSSARNVFFSNYNSSNQIIEFGINAGTFYIKLNSTVYDFTATALPMNDGLERKILLTFNDTTGFTLYIDDMTTAFSTISMSLTRNWNNSDIYIGASISTTPLPIAGTSLNATVCNIAFYDHELTLSERNNYIAIPSRI